MELAHALKEWQVAVSALENGDTIALLRKGGIREVGGKFQVQHEQVLLYPTYEHQNPQLLKSPYSESVQSVESGWHPGVVKIGSWATITHVFPVNHSEVLSRILPFHIWNESFVIERLQWKPNQPIYVLLLRAYRLAQPQQIAYSSTYGGCKSWIDLAEAISLDGSTPVLEDVAYNEIVSKIHTAIQP